MLKFIHYKKKFGSHVILNDITTTIGRGMYGLLGRNGAGKTTLMKVLVTLLKPSDGNLPVCWSLKKQW